MQPSAGATNSSVADAALSVQGRRLTCSGAYAEHDNPEYLPMGRTVARLPDGYAGAGCRKKRRPCCNGTDTGSDSARRESEQTSDGSPFARTPAEPPKERKLMTAAIG